MTIFKAERFYKGSVLDVRTYFRDIPIRTITSSVFIMMCLPQLEGTLVFWL